MKIRCFSVPMVIGRYRPTIGSKSVIGGSRLTHDVHHPVECARILHRDQAVTLELEFRHTHQHRKKSWNRGGGWGLRNFCHTATGARNPNMGRRSSLGLLLLSAIFPFSTSN